MQQLEERFCWPTIENDNEKTMQKSVEKRGAGKWGGGMIEQPHSVIELQFAAPEHKHQRLKIKHKICVVGCMSIVKQYETQIPWRSNGDKAH